MINLALSHKTRATLSGVSILLAYSMLTFLITDTIWVVLATDVLSGLAVIAIPFLLFPYFVTVNKPITYSYLGLKLAEGVLMIAGGILFLQETTAMYRNQIYEGVHLYTFIVSAYMLYFLLCQSKLVPKFISIWGYIACTTLLVNYVLKFVGVSHPAFDAVLLLMITNEFFLAFWLMFKGFSKHTVLHQ
jgi:hypothetical protein